MTARAADYVEHGWPVSALAVPWRGRCPCGNTCAAPHLVSEAVTTSEEVAKVWTPGHRWDIALMTSWFDVVDLPGGMGAELHAKLITRCPTATAGYAARFTRRWHFVVEAGAFSPGDVALADGVLHSGPDDWIAASPTRTPDGGRVGWIVEPYMSRWQPCSAETIADKLNGSKGITTTIANVTEGHG